MVGHRYDLKFSLSAIINVAVMATFSFIGHHLSIALYALRRFILLVFYLKVYVANNY